MLIAALPTHLQHQKYLQTLPDVWEGVGRDYLWLRITTTEGQ